MLISLHIKNYILIDELEIDFKKGLTAITGETGAGKSMIIDALNLLTGAKCSADVIRGEENQKAIIEATFDKCPDSLIDEFLECGLLEDKDDLLILRREILRTGKSIYRINQNVSTSLKVEELSSLLFDIHLQHHTLRLFNQKNYLSFIDNDEINNIKHTYQASLDLYLEEYHHYEDLQKRSNQVLNDIEFKKYQLDELIQASLEPSEEDSLNQELNVLNNFEALKEKLTNLHELLNKNETLNNLYQILGVLKELSKIDSNYQELIDKVSDAYFELEDLSETTSKKISLLDYDENKVNYLNERLNLIERLKKKYHQNNIKGLIDYQNNLKDSLTEDENLDFYLTESKNKLKILFNDLVEKARNLTNKREEVSNNLKEEIINSLKELQLDKVDLKFEFNKHQPLDEFDYKKFTKNGLDIVDILVSFNVGEELKPISQAASGGELSRVMLAFKNSLFVQRKLQLVVFDEIDTGISGIQADSVARKLKGMSDNFQVLAVTHLPIVAAVANTHLLVKKSSDLFQTSTDIIELNKQQRIDTIAYMISPLDKSGKARSIAEEMLNNK